MIKLYKKKENVTVSWHNGLVFTDTEACGIMRIQFKLRLPTQLK